VRGAVRSIASLVPLAADQPDGTCRAIGSLDQARRSLSKNVRIVLNYVYCRFGSTMSHRYPSHRYPGPIQNGSVRLHAVDSMAKRASGRRARMGRKAAIRSLEGLAASSVTIQASTVCPRIGIVTARERQDAINDLPNKNFAPALPQEPRTFVSLSPLT
jgi:hypothetical protein